jgi:hypothetical protein
VDACEYLVNDILPRVDSRVLRKHTVYIVGNALSQNLRHLEEVPNVRMVGWVPSLLPYLHHALLTVAPLRYGAGTKRKVIQALMAGTPTVASTIAIEGLGICDGEHALVADDPDTFAAHVSRLATNQKQWKSLSRAGRAHIRGLHDRQVVREQFERSLQAALLKPPKQLRLADLVAHPNMATDASYTALVERIGTTVQAQLPSGASVAVISKGDNALLQLEGLSARHFPSTPSGLYAGHHPADSAAAIALLEAARVEGTEFLVVPRTSFWWLDYYTAFREHLESRYRLLPAGHDTCLIFDLHMEVRT